MSPGLNMKKSNFIKDKTEEMPQMIELTVKYTTIVSGMYMVG